jgi:hypothetical protein
MQQPPPAPPRFTSFPEDFPRPSLLHTPREVWSNNPHNAIVVFRARMFIDEVAGSAPNDPVEFAELRVHNLFEPHAVKYMKTRQWTLNHTSLEFMDIVAIVVATPASARIYENAVMAVNATIKHKFRVGIGYPFLSWRTEQEPMYPGLELGLVLETTNELTDSEVIKLNSIKPHIRVRYWAELGAHGGCRLRAVVVGSSLDPGYPVARDGGELLSTAYEDE